ncbi:hypothetical protein [Gelidibacter mesophilus]|uniref:hypothetical protein n=1 Tax=Gelidibacter mesophilus TaxID=169050 RepID=UPI00040EA9A1|nr:hypothetical protein [Gelidibacter mesophilus]
MKSKDYLKDISEIKNMMHKSSRFISLSGLSGILAGMYALIGAFIAYTIIKDANAIINPGVGYFAAFDAVGTLFSIAVAVISLSIITGIFLTVKKAKKNNARIWDGSSKRLVINFLIPIVTGGLFCLVLIDQGLFGLIAPATLIFYGLGCINASKYTLGDIRYLGLINVALGLIATQFIGYGLYFWAFGFGIMHIVYGALMYFKYETDGK